MNTKTNKRYIEIPLESAHLCSLNILLNMFLPAKFHQNYQAQKPDYFGNILLKEGAFGEYLKRKFCLLQIYCNLCSFSKVIFKSLMHPDDLLYKNKFHMNGLDTLFFHK